MTQHRALAQRLAAQLSATVLERLLQAVVLILVARQVGPDAFGPFAACLALTKLLAVAFGLGLDTWLLRNGYRTGDRTELARHGTTCLAIRTGLGFIWLGGIVLLARWLDPVAYPPTLLVITALGVWFEELANIVWSTFKAALQNQTLLKFMTLAQATLLAVVVVMIANGVQAVEAFVWAYVVVSALHALVAIRWQVRTFGWRWQPGDLWPTLRATVPFALSTGLAMVYGRADIALVAHWLGARAAGLYSPAVSLANALALIPTAVFFVMVPILSRLYTEEPARAERMATRLVVTCTGLGLAAGAGLALVAQPLTQFIYGGAYAVTADLLALLGGVLAARFVSLALATALVAYGLQTQRVAVQATVALLNLGLNIWLIRRWGLPAAAGVYVLTEWVLVAGYAWLVWLWRRAPAKATVSVA
jgi:O-antigen/teichoic acid export membrane protein